MNSGILVNFRDDSLFLQSIGNVFSPSVLSFFSYKKPLFIGNSIIFNLEFSFSIY